MNIDRALKLFQVFLCSVYSKYSLNIPKDPQSQELGVKDKQTVQLI